MVTPPGPGISIPTTLTKQPSNSPNPGTPTTIQPKPAAQTPPPGPGISLTPVPAAPSQDPCAYLKASSPATYNFCRQQHGLPPAVSFGGVYDDDDYYDYDYGYNDDYGYDYYNDYGDGSSIDSSLKYRRFTIA
jgi:hypothetical protein